MLEDWCWHCFPIVVAQLQYILYCKQSSRLNHLSVWWNTTPYTRTSMLAGFLWVPHFVDWHVHHCPWACSQYGCVFVDMQSSAESNHPKTKMYTLHAITIANHANWNLTIVWWFTSAFLLRRSWTIFSWPSQLAIHNAVLPFCKYKLHFTTTILLHLKSSLNSNITHLCTNVNCTW